MKFFKSHFRYNKRQRNGIFYLLVLIIALQVFYYSYDKLFVKVSVENKNVENLQKRLDSAKRGPVASKKTFRVNPNFITDEIGYQIGMSIVEIDRLLEFRSDNKWVRNRKQFQEVTYVSDDLLKKLDSILFYPALRNPIVKEKTVVKKDKSKISLNTATAAQFQRIKGVGGVLSKRIVKYRTRLQGFSEVNQLNEVYGLQSEVVVRLLKEFELGKKPVIEKLNINTASFKEVLSIVYLNYEQTKAIFQYKNKVKKIEDLSELKKIAGFPIDKFERIALYLQAE